MQIELQIFFVGLWEVFPLFYFAKKLNIGFILQAMWIWKGGRKNAKIWKKKAYKKDEKIIEVKMVTMNDRLLEDI
jgi:hypothetical protein